jgi:hypothetical protein
VRATKAKPAAGREAIDALLDGLAHPLRQEIDAARRIVLGASPSVNEGVKWNAPSFHTEADWFATINLRSKDKLQLVFHLGAKVRPDLKAFQIADPNGLMAWRGKDRALVTVGAGRDIAGNRKALEAIVRAWIKQI